jgi:hypothetical protein
MRNSARTPSIVSCGDEHDDYLVADDLALSLV